MATMFRELPKAELHVHLEGSLTAETLCEIDPSLTSDDVHRCYSFASFPGFLQAYKWVVERLAQPRHYAIAARRLVEALELEGVTYAEVTLSVGVILWKGHDPHAVFGAIREELKDSRMAVYWVFDAVRHFGAAEAMRVAEIAVERARDGVVAFGIGGDEAREEARSFRPAFETAVHGGLKLAPHAGEVTGPASVWDMIHLGAHRIGHGIRAVDDPALLRHLRDTDIPLEICITSNVRTGAVSSIAAHPLRRIFDAGVPVVLNTDDPAMFDTRLTQEYELARTVLGFTQEELERIAANGFRYRFGV